MNRKKMLMIFNPKSGREEFRLNLFEVVNKFSSRGFEVTVYPTQDRGDCYRFIRERAEAFDYLVCSGGDGTVNETLDGLMPLEKRPVFGYIPSGTTNDFATTLGIPKDVMRAADVVLDGTAVKIDVGRFDGEYFAYVAAFGLFTDVPYATPQDKKNFLGHAAYMLEGVKRLASIKTYQCEMILDREEVGGEFILGMVSNATSIAGFQIPSERDISLEDGLFEVILVRKPKKLADLHDIAKRLLDYNHYEGDSIITRKASQITVTSQEPVPWTLDGEYGGETTCVNIENCKQALEILVPSASL